MKIAVLFTGHYRTFDQCGISLLSEFDKFNPDYFINTYYTKYNYHPYMVNTINGFSDMLISEDDFDNVPYKVSLFDCLDYANTIYSENYVKFDPIMLSDSKSHFLHIWKTISGLNLIDKYEKKQQINYDMVIICRMDVIPKTIFSLNFADYKNSVYLTNSHIKEACDHILVSSKENLCNMFNFMYDEFFLYTNKSSNTVMPHTLYDNGITHLGLNRVDYPMLDYILRFGGKQDKEA
jgi:hypothetical protein